MGLLRRPKVLLAIGLVLGSLIISHTILRFPFPPIQIKPEVKRNIFWESKEVQNWLSQTISEALDRILPGIGSRLAG